MAAMTASIRSAVVALALLLAPLCAQSVTFSPGKNLPDYEEAEYHDFSDLYDFAPFEAKRGEYLGPAALGKHYRFLADPRDGADEERIALVDGEHGVWGCDVVWNCVKVCPKRVPPTKGILATRERIEASRGGAGE